MIKRWLFSREFCITAMVNEGEGFTQSSVTSELVVC